MNRISRNAQGRTMFFRVLARAAILRKRTALSALMATAVAAAAATAMLNSHSDGQGKLQREFRNFGANIVVEAPETKSCNQRAITQRPRGVKSQRPAVSL